MNSDELLNTLKQRFDEHPERHEGVLWDEVSAKLHGEVLSGVSTMEATGGEPDVIKLEDGSLAFFDCAAESPLERRNLCYDEAALKSRKEHKPASSVEKQVSLIPGAQLLDEFDYFWLNTLGSFDRKTQSWIKTPEAVRKLGGALFGDNRFGRTFIYHNGAESYYRIRGFRVKITL